MLLPEWDLRGTGAVVFVTVGNAQQSFLRLLRAVDKLAAGDLLNGDTVFMQTGNNPDFVPRNCRYQAFMQMEEFEQMLARADLVICHGGCGTQLSSVRFGKTPVVMPRREKYGEHVNDHQVQIVEALAAEGYVIPAFEAEDLEAAIVKAQQTKCRTSFVPSPMLRLVSQAVASLIKN